MRVKCVICDTIHELPNDLPLAKNYVIVRFIRLCVSLAVSALRIIHTNEWKQENSVSLERHLNLMKNFNKHKAQPLNALCVFLCRLHQNFHFNPHKRR